MDGDVRLTTDVLGWPDMHQDSEWDGKCEFFKAGIEKAGPNTASSGELIASFEDPHTYLDTTYNRRYPY